MECKRCLYDDKVLGVTLNEEGVCNFCQMHDDLEKKYPVSWGNLHAAFDRIKERGKHHLYDCLVGISGGVDSTFMLHLCHIYGVRALAFHFDNGFNTQQAESNMSAILEHTKFKCSRFVINPTAWRDVNVAVLMAGVGDADIPNDIAMAKLMLDAAHQYDCPTILNGHSFRNEGSVPIGWTYMDGAYLKDMYRKYHGKEIPENFPILSVWDQVKASIHGIKHERILYHLGLTKPEQVDMLKKVIDFQEYTGHHAENDYTSFAGWMTYQRYGIDKRIVVLSAQIRSGRITKREAGIALSDPQGYPFKVLKRTEAQLDLSAMVQYHIGKASRKMFHDFHTYQKTFRRWRWLVKIGVWLHLFPETFYRKYTQKIKVK